MPQGFPKKNVSLGCCCLFGFIFSPLSRAVFVGRCAPRDTHDIATKPSPQLMVLRHGGPFRLLPHYHPNEKAECLCGWMESRGGSSMAGRTINPLCGPSEFWSLTCCTALVLLASSAAAVTLTNGLPSWVNVLFQSTGSPLFSASSANCHWLRITRRPGLDRRREEALTLPGFLSREAVEPEVARYVENAPNVLPLAVTCLPRPGRAPGCWHARRGLISFRRHHTAGRTSVHAGPHVDGCAYGGMKKKKKKGYMSAFSQLSSAARGRQE